MTKRQNDQKSELPKVRMTKNQNDQKKNDRMTKRQNKNVRMTFSTMTPRIVTFSITIRKCDTQHNDT